MLEDLILKKAKGGNVKYINLRFTDLFGSARTITFDAEKLDSLMKNGAAIDGSSIKGFKSVENSDLILKPDPSTFRILPFERAEFKTGELVCDIYTKEGNPFEGDPRHILKKTMERYGSDLTFNIGPELEFFLLEKEEVEPEDNGDYFSTKAIGKDDKVRKEMMDLMKAAYLKPDAFHHEVAQGQHEFRIEFDNALKMADKCITYKEIVKYAAEKHGMRATFMPKPFFKKNGSGMHCHVSIDRDGKNLFYDDGELSEDALYFIGGLLKHAREISAVFAPTVNSYKRLVPGYEAPTYLCYGSNNRSASIRIPASKGEKDTRIEFRCPDPSCNPYLAFSLIIAAGMEGIKEKTDPGEEIRKNVYRMREAELKGKNIESLPGSLDEALCEFEKSELARGVLGEHVFNNFLKTKKKEWKEYMENILIKPTEYEIRKYLGV